MLWYLNPCVYIIIIERIKGHRCAVAEVKGAYETQLMVSWLLGAYVAVAETRKCVKSPKRYQATL